MRTDTNMADLVRTGRTEAADSKVLNRIGRELAAIYGDTVRAPLPAAWSALIDQIGSGGTEPGLPVRCVSGQR